MIFEQLFEPVTSTYTYLIACPRAREAILIDPVVEEADRYLDRLAALGLTLRYTAETHIHADHVTAGAALRDRLGSRTVVHADSGADCADLIVRGGDAIQIGDVRIGVREVPGHTDADIAFVIYEGDRPARVLTGDALLIGGCGRTDFQSGDAGRLYDNIHAQIFTLPDDTAVFPGHDYKGNTSSTVGQERAHNARLGNNRSRDSFVALMADLKLAYPRFIDRALPANRACGRETPAPPVQGA